MSELIVDSGSTKTVWKVVTSEQSYIIKSEGINPNYLSEKEIRERIPSEYFLSLENTVQKIAFYGAGCSNSKAKFKLEKILKIFFPKATIQIDSDMLGACLAVSKNQQSWVCILGTGSNACVFDGKGISYQPLSLGYLLADEGSGNAIGKALVKAYFLNRMPEAVCKAFRENYNLTYESFLENTYQKSKPNKWLASFADFTSKFSDDAFIQKIIANEFNAFIENYLLPELQFKNLQVNFVGSIAFYFQELLAECLAKYDFQLGNVLKSPLE